MFQSGRKISVWYSYLLNHCWLYIVCFLKDWEELHVDTEEKVVVLFSVISLLTLFSPNWPIWNLMKMVILHCISTIGNPFIKWYSLSSSLNAFCVWGFWWVFWLLLLLVGFFSIWASFLRNQYIMRIREWQKSLNVYLWTG